MLALSTPAPPWLRHTILGRYSSVTGAVCADSGIGGLGGSSSRSQPGVCPTRSTEATRSSSRSDRTILTPRRHAHQQFMRSSWHQPTGEPLRPDPTTAATALVPVAREGKQSADCSFLPVVVNIEYASHSFPRHQLFACINDLVEKFKFVAVDCPREVGTITRGESESHLVV